MCTTSQGKTRKNKECHQAEDLCIISREQGPIGNSLQVQVGELISLGSVGASIKRSDQGLSEMLLIKAKNLNESLKREN